MSKNDPDKYIYMNKAKIIQHDGRFYVDDMDVDEWLLTVYMYCSEKLNVTFSEDVKEVYYGLNTSISSIRKASSYGNEDLFRAWVEQFLTYMESAVFLCLYRRTSGSEKDKFKVAEPAAKEFRKNFK